MISGKIKNNRNNPQVLVENKLTFAAHECELGIYDTYQQAKRVALSSDQLFKLRHQPKSASYQH